MIETIIIATLRDPEEDDRPSLGDIPMELMDEMDRIHELFKPRCPLCGNNHSEKIRICKLHQTELLNKL